MRWQALQGASDGDEAVLSIREMSVEDLRLAFSWAVGEKWNPGKFDSESYLALGSDGFLMLYLDEEPVGSISLVRLSDEFAFIGLFIVKPEYRNKGLGTKLFKAALEKLGSVKTIGLYGVPSQVSRYKSHGFGSLGSTSRYSRKSAADDVSSLLRSGTPGLFEAMCEYDRGVFPGNRSAWFKQMLQLPQTFAFVSLKGGVVNGFGIVRPLMEGFRVGPLYADDFESAQALFRVLSSRIPTGSSLILDSPETCSFIKMFAEWAGLELVSEVEMSRMYKAQGGLVRPDPEKELAVASLELG